MRWSLNATRESSGAQGRRVRFGLVGLGLVSLAGWCWLSRGLDAAGRSRDVWTFLALGWVLFALALLAFAAARRAPRAPVREILVFAALFRAVMLLAGLPAGAGWADLRDDLLGRAVTYEPFLLYDNDVWRYLWDGHVQARGFDPYRITPRDAAAGAEEGDPNLADLFEPELWWDVYDNVAFRGHVSVYPPFAQLFFRLSHALAPGSVLALKGILALCDFLTCLVLLRLLRAVGSESGRGQRSAAVVLYAWNPLPIKEIAGSGHVDALMVLPMILALALLIEGRAARGLAALALSALAKLASLALFPIALRHVPWRWWWLPPAVAAGVAAPYLAGLPDLLAGLAVFGRDWQLNAGAWNLARLAAGAALDLAGVDGRPEAIAHLACKTVTAAAVIGWTIWVWRAAPSAGRLLRAAFWILAVPVLLNAAVMPWYVLWALPLAVAIGNRSWLLFSALVPLSYLIYVDQREDAWWLILEHGAFYLALGAELWWRSGRRAGDSDGAYQRRPPPPPPPPRP